MVFSGITANNAVQVVKDFAAALPEAKLYGPDGVADSGFAGTKAGYVLDRLQRRHDPHRLRHLRD